MKLLKWFVSVNGLSYFCSVELVLFVNELSIYNMSKIIKLVIVDIIWCWDNVEVNNLIVIMFFFRKKSFNVDI